VRAPCPVPASKISRGGLVGAISLGCSGWRSRRETIRFASRGYI
jgi:hypothetical protein